MAWEPGALVVHRRQPVAGDAHAADALLPRGVFSGAILPVHVMAGTGAAVSTAMPDRWAFEAVGHDLGVRALLAYGGSPLVATYGDAGMRATTTYWLYLGTFAVVFFAAAWVVLARSLRRTR